MTGCPAPWASTKATCLARPLTVSCRSSGGRKRRPSARPSARSASGSAPASLQGAATAHGRRGAGRHLAHRRRRALQAKVKSKLTGLHAARTGKDRRRHRPPPARRPLPAHLRRRRQDQDLVRPRPSARAETLAAQAQEPADREEKGIISHQSINHQSIIDQINHHHTSYEVSS